MARINIEDDIWTDPRFMKLALAVGDHLKATGLIVMAWRVAQKFWLNGKRPIPREVFERDLDEALVSVDLAERNEAGDVYIKGSEEQFAWLIQRQQAGKGGGKKSGKARVEKKRKSPKRNEAGSSGTKRAEPSISISSSFSFSNSGSDSGSENTSAPGADGTPVASEGVSPVTLVWRAYRDAYARRYGEAPPWNKTQAGKLAHFIKRIPVEDAPDLAAWYVSHPNFRYSNPKHPLGLLLMDAETLHVEWRTGNAGTSQGARQAEKTSALQEQLRRIAEGKV